MSTELDTMTAGTPARTVETVTLEIKTLHKQAQQIVLGYAIEIGRRLVEVKSMLQHGEWGNYLKNEVNYSQSTAQNFMRIFEEYGASQMGLFGPEAKSQTLGDLPYTKALKLLAIPEEEREEFVQEHDIEDLSTRELDTLIRERDEARKKAEDAEAEAKQAKDELSTITTREENLKKVRDLANEKLEQETKAAEDLQAQLEELRNKPIDVAVSQPDDAALDAARKEAAEKAKADTEAILKKKIEKAEKAKKDAEDAKAKAEQELNAAKVAAEQTAAVVDQEKKLLADQMDDLRKKLAVASSSDISIFGVWYKQAQTCDNNMLECLDRLAMAGDKESAEKLKNALRALCNQTLEKMGAGA
jgi:chromosome segregation ATPase